MRISEMAKTARSELSQVDEQEVQRRIANRRPLNLMMKPGRTGYHDVTEADAPAEMRGKILDLVRKEFVENYGAPSDSTAYRDMIYDYARGFSDDADISKAVHGMYALKLNEQDRLLRLAEENFSGWKAGKAFDKDKMWQLIQNRMDITV